MIFIIITSDIVTFGHKISAYPIISYISYHIRQFYKLLQIVVVQTKVIVV